MDFNERYNFLMNSYFAFEQMALRSYFRRMSGVGDPWFEEINERVADEMRNEILDQLRDLTLSV